MITIDIEMPKRCGECPCFHAEYPMHCQLIKPPDKNKQLVAPYGLPRPDWCPLKGQESLLGIQQTADSITFISTGTAQQGESRGISLGKMAMHEWLKKELLYRGLLNDDIRAVFDLAEKDMKGVCSGMTNREKIIKGLEDTAGYFRHLQSVGFLGDLPVFMEHECHCNDALALLKEQEDSIRILTSDLEDLQKEHAKLLDKKIPLITNGQEVVRCADCKHHGKDVCGAASGIAYPPPDDWFCADGERE